MAATGPNGPRAVVAASAAMAGTVVTDTLTPPGGSWDAGDNDAYGIDLNGGEVFAAAATLGPGQAAKAWSGSGRNRRSCATYLSSSIE